jgi:hypothetical protein
LGGSTNVVADPKGCSLRVSRQTNGNPASIWSSENPISASYYLEEILDVDVLSSEDYLHRHRHLGGGGLPEYQENVQPQLYSVAVRAWGWSGGAFDDFKFPTKESAEQFAAFLRESTRQCGAARIRSTPNGVPSLAETLSFIAEKLSTQGPVSIGMKETLTNGAITSNKFMPRNWQVNYSHVTPSETTCAMSIDFEFAGEKYSARLSLSRIAKIELLSLQDYLENYQWLPPGVQVQNVTEASLSFVLNITSPDVKSKQLYFSNETLADRVAKAMVHAVELCGGGKKEPF